MNWFDILASKWDWTDTAIVAFFAIGIPVAIFFNMIDASSKKEEEERQKRQPFLCPYCGTKIFYEEISNGHYYCYECWRSIIHGRVATAEERAEIQKEEADRAAVESYLRNSDVFHRLVESVRYPDLFIGEFYVSMGKAAEVEVTIYTRKVNPFDTEDVKIEKIERDPVPLGFRIETKAGRAVFYHALLHYLQSNYSYVYESYLNSSRDIVSVHVKR